MTAIAPTTLDRIAAMAQDRWGLHITDQKQDLLSNRLSKFLRKSDFDDVESDLDFLEGLATDDDLLDFFDLLSTNVTSFFREPQHFDCLEQQLYASLAAGSRDASDRRIRIWSAACSFGQEPYSLAMHAMEKLPDFESWDFRILASDLSKSALEHAAAGIYPKKLVDDLPAALLKRHFLRGKGQRSEFVKVAPHIRDLVTLRRLNLMESWPLKGPFDAIFCRNVMIYFDRETKERLVNRMFDLLRPGGILAVGSAETISSLDTGFRSLQASVYVK